MQKVRCHSSIFFLSKGLGGRIEQASTACKHWVLVSLSLPTWGAVSPFPHGTSSLSVRAA
ncbi:Uncharacterized protein COCOBI_mt-0480 (mitochondrion) [Coccomyxa sp. Obi]|nr:Uncharacterized protein COCOBI_mt-0480 [Coccomyxa sp. Obi]